MVLGLSLVFTHHRVKKCRLRESQKRSDQVEMLLQEMDDALWDQQEGRPWGPGGNLEPKFGTHRYTYRNNMEQLIQGISGIFREIQGAVDFYMISKTSQV